MGRWPTRKDEKEFLGGPGERSSPALPPEPPSQPPIWGLGGGFGPWPPTLPQTFQNIRLLTEIESIYQVVYSYSPIGGCQWITEQMLVHQSVGMGGSSEK